MVKVLFFAALRERVGEREVNVEMADGSDVSDLYAALSARYPVLAGYGANLMTAVNADYVPGNYVLHDGDEVVFIPPVSGGTTC